MPPLEVKVDPEANDRYGAFQVGQRDELVTALGLATQVDAPTTDTVFDLADTWRPAHEVLEW